MRTMSSTVDWSRRGRGEAVIKEGNFYVCDVFGGNYD